MLTAIIGRLCARRPVWRSVAAWLLVVCMSSPVLAATLVDVDGDVTLSAGTVQVNSYSTIANVGGVSAGATSITVQSAAALSLPAASGAPTGNLPLQRDSLLLLYQAQGATIDTSDANTYGAVTSYGGAGRWEAVRVDSVSGNVITLYSNSGTGCGGLQNAYSQGAMVVRMPAYRNLTVSGSGQIVAPDWSGTTGGIVALSVSQTALLNASPAVNVTGRGFRGGPYQNAFTDYIDRVWSAFRYQQSGVPIATNDGGAPKGESIAGFWTALPNGGLGRGAPANGGGGGNGHNAGGGGGANGGVPGNWNFGVGNPDTSGSGWATAWALDPVFSAPLPTTNAGGGRGGYTYSQSADNSGTNPSPLVLAPGGGAWGGNLRLEVGGRGGRPLDRSGGRYFFGGGGGSGDGNDGLGAGGGRGGGIVFLFVGGELTGTGSIVANGAQGGSTVSGHNDAPGGGGGGGTIVAISENAITGTLTLSAQGGAGGNQGVVTANGGREAEGPGGGGGGGVIAVPAAGSSASAGLQAGVHGTTGSPAMQLFTPNGATRGGIGSLETSPTLTSGQAACTLPITLAYFDARNAAGGLSIEWSTATEAFNAGFNLYGRPADLDHWERLNDALIPSTVIDSTEPQHYAFNAADITGYAAFRLEDVDLQGARKTHGPFLIGEAFGARPQPLVLDWKGIAAENAASVSRAAMLKADTAAQPTVQSARLWVRESGIHRVSFEDLLAAGVDLTGVNRRHIAIVDEGQPVARHVESDHRFGPGGFIEFVGQPTDNRYSLENAYLLRVDPGQARDVNTRTLSHLGPSVVEATHTETFDGTAPHIFSFESPSDTPWLDEYIIARAGSSGSVAREFTLSNWQGGAVNLEVNLWGRSYFDGPDPDHHVVLRVNDQVIADRRFDGLNVFTLAERVPGSALKNGVNTLTIEAPGDTGYAFDYVALEGFKVRYERATVAVGGRWTGQVEPGSRFFRLSGLGESELVGWADLGIRMIRGRATPKGGSITIPARFAKATPYWVSDPSLVAKPRVEADIPTALRRVQGADYLIVAHPLFADGLAALTQRQASRGLSVQTVTTDAIYAAYSDHEPDAAAIRQFIAASKGVRYVLLVGGDSFDYRGYIGDSRSFVPTLYAALSPIVKWAPSDALLADGNGDSVPEVAIGRLPVRTLAELDALLEKILNHSAGGQGLLVAGVDDSNQYGAINQGFAQLLQTAMKVSTADLNASSKSAVRTVLFDAFASRFDLISYMGHTSYSNWDTSNLMVGSDVAQLSASAGLVTQWGCYGSFFSRANGNTMAHALMLTADRGASAVLGSTALTETASHEALGSHFYPAIAQGKAFGDALLDAQRRLAAENRESYRDAILGMVLLGDPAQTMR